MTDCIGKIINTHIDHAKDLDIVMQMYNLIEYSYNDSQTSGSLWQYYRDEAAINSDGNIDNFSRNSTSFKFNIVLIQLGLRATASATDAAIQKKIFGFSMTALITSNKDMDDMKIILWRTRFIGKRC